MKRDLYWDTLKFCLIFLVIYGHIISGGGYSSRFNLAMHNFLYMFHMPLFLFISGRFSHIHNRNKYKRNILRLLETLIFIQIVSSTILIMRGNAFSLRFLYEPNTILWYLVSLIYYRMIIYFSPTDWLSYRKRVLIISFSLSILAGFIPVSHTFTIQRSLACLPFFMLGYYSTDIDFKSIINRIPLYFVIGTLLAILSILFFILNTSISAIAYCCFPYWSDDISQIAFRLLSRCIYIISAIVLCAMVMRLIHPNKLFSKWGENTLFIYIYHAFILNLLLFPMIRTCQLPQNEFLLVIYSIITTLCLVMLSSIKFLTKLLNPLSSWFLKQ